MKSIRGKAKVDADGILTMRLDGQLAPGEHDVRLTVLDGAGPAERALPFDLPMVEIDEWPVGLSTRRSELYGDWGR